VDNLIIKKQIYEFNSLEKKTYETKRNKSKIKNKSYLLDRIEKTKHELNDIIGNKSTLMDDEISEISLYLDRLLMLYIKNSRGGKGDREEKWG